MSIQSIRHKLIPNWARNKYYDYLREQEYKKMCKLPKNQYEKYLCDRYKFMTHGKTMDFDNPKTFSQKLQWMKLYDVTQEKILCSDKYAVRKYIADKIGEEYLIPLVSINGQDHFLNAKDIDFDKLPEKFVMKCNHGSHYNIIVKEKSKLTNRDIRKIRKKLNVWLKERYEFKVGIELQYQGITPAIIIEQYMEFEDELPPDYKFYCFNGEVKFLRCVQGRDNELKQSCMNLHFEKLPFTLPNCGRTNCKDVTISKPDNFDKMVEIAQLLCKGFSHVRVDLYNIHGKIYFGELTFCNASGYEVAVPKGYDEIIGSWIQLDKNVRNNTYEYRER